MKKKMADTSSDSVETSQEPSPDKDSVDCLAASDNSESNFGDSDCAASSEQNGDDHSREANMSHYGFSSRSGILSSPRLANNPFAVKTIIPTRSVADSTDNKELRPILAPATFTPSRAQGEPDATRPNCPSSSFKLNPPTLANPFAKCDSVTVAERRSELPEVTTSKESELSDDSTQDSGTNVESKCVASTAAAPVCVIVSPITSTVSTDTLVTNSNNNNTEGRFSIIQTPPQLNSFSQSCQNVDFVFGQKMNERVANTVSSLPTTATANGMAELKFSQSLQSESGESDGELAQTNGESSVRTPKSLEESAQEYESRKVKRTYEEVLVVTGEEEEENVLQVINCKLFVFDKTTSSWLERGRGTLRLNDKHELQDGSLQSRLVMRTQGSLRVVLNTKVWAAMAVERPSSKSVQITAMDGDTIRVFLIMASPNDAEQLHNALNCRVTTLKTADEQRSSTDKRVSDDAPHCLPSTTTSEESSCSPKRRRVTPPGSLEDDSSGSECGPHIQDTSIDSTSRNKATTLEGTTSQTKSATSVVL